MVVRAVMVGHVEPIDLLDDTSTEEMILEVAKEHAAALRKSQHILTCTFCKAPVHPRHCASGIWVFSHNPGSAAACPLAARESDAHVAWKTILCQAARTVPGWTATVEVVGDGVDPDTGKPPVIDVLARQVDGRSKGFGYEIQLSPISEGHLLGRDEIRQSILEKCDWVTVNRPQWAHLVPWTQVRDETGQALVIDGICRRVHLEHQGDIDVKEDPFPLQLMVKSQLRRRVYWADGSWRWISEPSTTPRQQTGANQSAKGRAQEWCDRHDHAPPFTDLWDDNDWQLRAHIAHERLAANLPLVPVDEAALAKYPVEAALDDRDQLIAGGANLDDIAGNGTIVYRQKAAPCRWCKRAAYTADRHGPVHPCCEKNATPDCPACRASAAHQAERARRRNRR